MSDQYASFSTARARFEEIAEQATAKDTPLEKAIELLEEGARIAHRCTELLDHTEWRSAVREDPEEALEEDSEGGSEKDSGEAEDPASDPRAAADDGEEPDPGDADADDSAR